MLRINGNAHRWPIFIRPSPFTSIRRLELKRLWWTGRAETRLKGNFFQTKRKTKNEKAEDEPTDALARYNKGAAGAV
jgi:hypothetical protein